MAIALQAALDDDVLREIMSDPYQTVVVARAATQDPRTARRTSRCVAKKYDVIGGKTGYTDAAGYCFITGGAVRGQGGRDGVPRADGKQTRFADFNRVAAWLSAKTREAGKLGRVSVTRREMLETLGLASAYAFAFGCGAPQKAARRAPEELSSEVRAWLRDAVATIHGAGLTGSALAVSRSHSVAAIDVLGAGVNHARADAVVLIARDAHGRREQVTSDLTREGVGGAVRALVGRATPAQLEFGPPAPPPAVPKPDPAQLADSALLDSIAAIAKRDHGLGEPDRLRERPRRGRRRDGVVDLRSIAISSSGCTACAARSRASRGTACDR